jgi:hypothetical protein
MLFKPNCFGVAFCCHTVQNFYSITSGRQPDPQRTQFDAYVYATHLQLPPPPATSAQQQPSALTSLPACGGGGGGGGTGGSGLVTTAWGDGGSGGVVSAATAAAWNLAMAPLRNVVGHLNSCIPWLFQGSG